MWASREKARTSDVNGATALQSTRVFAQPRPESDIEQTSGGTLPWCDGLGFYIARNDAAARAKGVKRMCIPFRSAKSAERRRKQEEALVPSTARSDAPVTGGICVVERRQGFNFRG